MKFRDFMNESRFKGLKRAFVAANPGMPAYVASDLYNSRVGFPMRRALGMNALAPTADLGDIETSRGSTLGTDVSGAMRSLAGIQWSPRPTMLTVGPLDFDEDTLNAFLFRRFGFREMQRIRDDAARTMTQWDLAAKANPGQNEPIIVIKDGNKYKLLEGWHRTMSYLLYLADPSKGAPPDQIEFLKKGDTMHLDFTRWRPVVLQAYVGEKTRI